jgi:hypothetical protein
MEATFHQKMARRKMVVLNCNGRAVFLLIKFVHVIL